MSSEHEPVKQQTDKLNSGDSAEPTTGQTDPSKPIKDARPADQPETPKKTEEVKPVEDARPADQPETPKKTDELRSDSPIKLSEEDARIAASVADLDTSTLALTCPVCGLVNRPGELACSRCGTILAPGGTTRKLDADDDAPKPASWPTGDVIVTGQAPIIFEVEGEEMTVPVSEVITVGRISEVPDDSRPDVDLSKFGAGEKGVSRKHIKIKRKNILVYVADLGSTNGTLLNGRRLIPNAERLLRNGDELQLGRLKIKVKF